MPAEQFLSLLINVAAGALYAGTLMGISIGARRIYPFYKFAPKYCVLKKSDAAEKPDIERLPSGINGYKLVQLIHCNMVGWIFNNVDLNEIARFVQ